MEAVPFTPAEPVHDILHGVSVTDPYRWLEDQDSPRTREWLKAQKRYARTYLDGIPGRGQIRQRVQEFLAVETSDSILKFGTRYFFRKRLREQEQPCIYMREGADGHDQLLIDPARRGTGSYTAVKALSVSPDDRLLLYEVKEGGERTSTFELLEIDTRKRLSDRLPRGYLRGFAFAPDSKSFYYVHEPIGAARPFYRAVFQHVLGTPITDDREIFFAGDDQKIRLGLTSDGKRLAFLVSHFLDKTLLDVYLKPFDSNASCDQIVRGITCMLGLRLLGDRIIAITDHEAPNRRIVEIKPENTSESKWIDIVPETEMMITAWRVAGNLLFVSYVRDMARRICAFTLSGKQISDLPIPSDQTIAMIGGSADSEELLLQVESFTEPIGVFRYSPRSNTRTLWTRRASPFRSADYGHDQVWFPSKDGTKIPMFIAGRRDLLKGRANPTIMTAYGGYGISGTPQFSIFVAFLMERGCLFALPGIRGGSEFGVEWHRVGKARNRQTTYDDFLCAAEWLIESKHTHPKKLAIFGGSNSGLLVGAALTQRPDLFRAVVCMVPILDMLRYHLFDNAHVWKDEFGTADHPDDFIALAGYSPYHRVRDGISYPSTMIVSGDADQNCNPLHARKMTARLQAASVSTNPILLDYSKFRGHSPVLPLSERIDGLTDRMAFLCDQLQLSL